MNKQTTQRMDRIRRILPWTVGLIVATLALDATASGLLVARFGGEHGHPMTDNPTAIYYNPAGLALRSGTRLYIDGTFAYRSASYDRPASAIDTVLDAGQDESGTPAGAVGANSGEATLLNFPAAPFIGVVSDLTVPNLAVGAALFVPIGGAAEWDSTSAVPGHPGAEDGSQRWWSINGTIRSLYISGAAAYRLKNIGLSFGLAGSLVLSQIETVRARNSDGTDDLVSGASGGLQEGRSLVLVDSTDFALGAGVLYEPSEAWRIGLSYQSQPAFGQMELEGTLTNALGTTAISKTDITIEQAMPDVFRLGASFRPGEDVRNNPKWEYRLFADFARWSLLEKQCLLQQGLDDGMGNPLTPNCNLASDGSKGDAVAVTQNVQRDWQDAFGVRAGVSHFYNPNLEVYLGAGYDGNAIPDKTLDPAIFDMDKVSASLGAKMHILERSMALSATYTQVFYFERTISPRGPAPDGTSASPFAPPSRQPDAAGTYNQSIGALNINLEYMF